MKKNNSNVSQYTFVGPNMGGKNAKILIISERFYPEEFGINDLAREWQQRGYDVEVLTQLPSYPFDKIYDGFSNKFYQKTYWDGIKIHRVFSLMGYKKGALLKILNYLCFALLASFISLFIGRQYDRIFIYQVGPLTQAIPAILIKKLYRK